MRSLNILRLTGAIILAASFAEGATMTGTVKGPDGAPFRAAFVQARNARMRMTVMALSDGSGRYRLDNLPAGDYQVLARTVGYRSDPRTGIVLQAGQNLSLDWVLQKQAVRWTEIPIYQGFQLMPPGKGKERFVQSCGASCHGFQRMIAISRDAAGWREAVKDNRERIGGGVIGQIKDDQDAADLAEYLSHIFGAGPGALPPSPADLPAYEQTLPQFSDERGDANLYQMEYFFENRSL